MLNRPPLRAIAAAGRELASFARVALLLRHDTEHPILPEQAKDGDDIVVLLHGLFATAGVLRPLRSAIERYNAIWTATWSYPAGPGVEALAERLGSVLQSLPPQSRLHLCGHSVGGIVCRWYAQQFDDHRVVQTISLATPFAGIQGARLLGFSGVKDLDPGSPLLRKLLVGSATSSIPHLSIVAADDTIVRAPLSHALPNGQVLLMPDCGHNTLLFHPQMAAHIARQVVRSRKPAPAPSHGSDPSQCNAIAAE